jgi:hypothetical protein
MLKVWSPALVDPTQEAIGTHRKQTAAEGVAALL